MQYNVQLSTIDNDVLEDDIDILFQQLEPVAPPPSFVPHILQLVSAYTTNNITGSPVLWDELDNWLSQQRKRSLC